MASINAKSGLLFFDFSYKGQRCREYTKLTDTSAHRKRMETILARSELIKHCEIACVFADCEVVLVRTLSDCRGCGIAHFPTESEVPVRYLSAAMSGVFHLGSTLRHQRKNRCSCGPAV